MTVKSKAVKQPLTPIETACLLAIGKFAGQAPSLQEVADAMDYRRTIKTVSRLMHILEAKGYIRWRLEVLA